MKILKYVLIYCIMLTLSCSMDSNSKELVTIPNLKGEWSLSSYFGVRGNVCPKVVIVDSKNGNIINPSEEILDFSYIIHDGKISFHIEEGLGYNGLNSEFNYTLKSDSILQYLVLVTPKYKGKITLIREK